MTVMAFYLPTVPLAHLSAWVLQGRVYESRIFQYQGLRNEQLISRISGLFCSHNRPTATQADSQHLCVFHGAPPELHTSSRPLQLSDADRRIPVRVSPLAVSRKRSEYRQPSKFLHPLLQ
ncbi:hypothetical protein B0I72DRAFT_173320 [Yarrowia lipolytica]|nr:hypothetical protein BKA91DRAFT_167252 [Yarrowia lipolytica]KAE8172711.1 hypothetical protein BKA90DRAFT_168050 [Yarrowia lipolytica]RDW33844.1 hypothetical protein B0I72DRAFT_173320 [Yarrowia lipolytica]RDW38120.1 hypothetical protein B0I73DRAFT_170443 [Yarrowia lipolytica]RDW49232.1 hypothetical protein B0I74DRAFT_170989 [Yarrowia lipolytica]